MFAIPYERDFTLIGTTDVDHAGAPSDAACSPEEAAYLCHAASGYFATPVRPDDVVWTYSGVRPLYDEGAGNASSATRDYSLEVDGAPGDPPLLNIFGGKITTYRKLAEAALAKLQPHLPEMSGPWTGGAPLPGGDFPVDGVGALIGRLQAQYPFLDGHWAERLVKAYGTMAFALLGNAGSADDLGLAFGGSLTEAEVRWLMQKEWARTADDILWRRSKLGLRLSPQQAKALADYVSAIAVA